MWKRVPHWFGNSLNEIDMKVFVVLERIDYGGEYIKGIYSTREEAGVRQNNLSQSEYVSDDVKYVIMNVTVGEDLS